MAATAGGVTSYEGLSEAEMKYLVVTDKPDLTQGLDASATKRLVWVPHEEHGFAVASVKEERDDEVIVQVGG